MFRLYCLMPALAAAVPAIALAANPAPERQPTWAQASASIQHVIIIMQENRSFDNYFGTFPGVNGYGRGLCVPLDPSKPRKGCVAPFHDPHDVNAGGPHSAKDATKDLDNGVTVAKLDGFVDSQTRAAKDCKNPNNPKCSGSEDGADRHDVMGYHTAEEIPNYWSYAQNFVLQDSMFQGVRSWSWPSHLALTSEWVAKCKDYSQAETCKTELKAETPHKASVFPWVNLFQLLGVHNISWKYYLGEGQEPDCEDDEMTCDPQGQSSKLPSIWNPAGFFSWVKSQGPAYLKAHNPPINQFLVDISGGTLPQVSWVVPSQAYSEHPPAGVTAGMEYVTSLVNAVMQSSYWYNTAIFVVWDDWGGFYDNVIPPNVDESGQNREQIEGYGLRVPGLMISAYAKAGMIDSSVYSFDAYATFFENLFMSGARLDPAQLGNPDHRPDIRDALTQVTFLNGQTVPIGNLLNEFDFTQAPHNPLVLSTHIPTGIATACRNDPKDQSEHCQLPTVTVSWQPVTNPQIPGPFTYHVTRDGTDLQQCIGTATTCQDTPGAGAHLYRAYSVDPNGTQSPTSAAAEADEPK